MGLDLRALQPSDPLIILDVANNHNGSVPHATRIIREVADAVGDLPRTIAIKFQYRDLATFIHPDYSNRMDLPYVKRFLSTRLAWEDFAELTAYAHELGFLTSATPFDEASVRHVVEHGHDFVKIASASFTDWPLLEAAAASGRPMVVSTAGASVGEIDRVVAFLGNRGLNFALMHCVAAYPTPDADLNLDRIDLLRHRYEGVPVGYSTHERPDNDIAVAMALAKGCALLERHVGVPDSETPNNGYSSDPSQIRTWLDRTIQAGIMCGGPSTRPEANEAEAAALRGLRRGVWLRRDVAAGEVLDDDDVFFAIPLQPGQLAANDWSKYLTVEMLSDCPALAPVLSSSTSLIDRNDQVLQIVRSIEQLLDRANVTYPTNVDLEISHHYGLDLFPTYGMCMITVVNREYCKKLLMLLPGQEHPEQWHNSKEETLHVLHGDVEMWLDGVPAELGPGDMVVIEPGMRHRFTSRSGAVIEEISTTHHPQDSHYTDDTINENRHRKSYARFWGRIADD